MKIRAYLWLLPVMAFQLSTRAQITPSTFAGYLPLFVIDTQNQSIGDANRIVADLKIIQNPEGELNHYDDTAISFEGKIAIEIRGNSSQMFPKKSYSFETQNPDSSNLNVSLLGLPEENDWILYGPYSDKSLLRNVLAYSLTREMGDYATRTAFCEVFINGDYKGLYILAEKIKRDKNRVDVDELEPEDNSGDALSGGYIVAINWRGGSDYDWISPVHNYNGNYLDLRYQYEDPTAEEITGDQAFYIKYYISQFELMMNGTGYNDPATGYNRSIDVFSFIDFFITQEITHNVDAYRLSTYLFKVRDSKGGRLFAGPVWDFNLGFGNADYANCWETSGWAIDNPDVVSAIPFYFKKLRQDSEYNHLLACRWNELRDNVLDTTKLMNQIDSLVLVLGDAVARNNQRWNVIGNYVWPNYFVGTSYAEEIDYLKEWMKERLIWMDSQLPAGSTSCSSLDEGRIVLTEIMYEPDEINDSGDWFEVKNNGTSTINLAYYSFKDENNLNSFRIPVGILLAPGAYLVFASDLAKFNAAYPDVVNVTGSFTWKLGDKDAIRLYDADNLPLIDVRFSDENGWPDLTGTYASLEIVNESGNSQDPYNWMPGCPGGSPGKPYEYPCPLRVDESLEHELMLLTNPVNEEIVLLNPKRQELLLELYASDGRMLDVFLTGGERIQKDVRNYAQGVYYLKIHEKNRQAGFSFIIIH